MGDHWNFSIFPLLKLTTITDHSTKSDFSPKSMILSALLAPELGSTLITAPGENDTDEAASEEIVSLYYADGDPTDGHRSQQSDQLRHAGVTGCVVWNGAVVLARSLAYWEDDLLVLRLERLCVLELGAGTGLLVLQAAMLGARVVATEQGERLKLLRKNVERH